MVIIRKVSSSKISLVTLMVINPKAAIVVLSSAVAIVLRAKMIFNSVLMRMSSSNFRPQTTTRVEMLMSASSCQVISLRPRQLVRLAQCQLSLSQRDMLVSQLWVLVVIQASWQAISLWVSSNSLLVLQVEITALVLVSQCSNTASNSHTVSQCNSTANNSHSALEQVNHSLSQCNNMVNNSHWVLELVKCTVSHKWQFHQPIQVVSKANKDPQRLKRLKLRHKRNRLRAENTWLARRAPLHLFTVNNLLMASHSSSSHMALSPNSSHTEEELTNSNSSHSSNPKSSLPWYNLRPRLLTRNKSSHIMACLQSAQKTSHVTAVSRGGLLGIWFHNNLKTKSMMTRTSTVMKKKKLKSPTMTMRMIKTICMV